MASPTYSFLPPFHVHHLRGEWQLHKKISGGAAFAGSARFAPQTPACSNLIYHETGLLTLGNGTTFKAENTYIFVPEETGFCVFFAENPPRLFHKAVVQQTAEQQWQATCNHLCSADHYTTTYTFFSAKQFVVLHHVTGPKKGYRMQCIFTRKSIS